MSLTKLKNSISLVVLTMLLSACASVPEHLQTGDEESLVPYQAVVLKPDSYTQQTARWGGVIAKVSNLPNSTMVEVVHRELTSASRPKAADFSAGRFRVYVDGFLDPMVFEKGRSITFLGEIGPAETGTVGERQYQFPVLLASSYKMWPEIQRVDVSSIDFGVGFWPSSYYDYWYGWHRQPFSIRHKRVIIRDSDKRGASGENTAPSPADIHPPKVDKPELRPQPSNQNATKQKAID